MSEGSVLMKNEGIVRNRLKIEAVVENAKRILAIKIKKAHGSFAEWLDLHHPRTKEEWVKLFARRWSSPAARSPESF